MFIGSESSACGGETSSRHPPGSIAGEGQSVASLLSSVGCCSGCCGDGLWVKKGGSLESELYLRA